MLLKDLAFVLAYVTMVAASKVDRPRGVSLTKKVMYNPDRDFTCFDGTRTIPFSQVNDDYCDCSDGSDEPGTSACPHGSFHCTNAGFRPMNIPSSRVNDGICDCCDGSDEWKHPGSCVDNCVELWKSAREELMKQAEAATKGYEIRKGYSTRGQTRKSEDQQKLESLEKEIQFLKDSESHLKLQKELAETSEKEAKDAEQAEWDAFKAKIQEHQETRQAADAFSELDANKDGSVSIEELRQHTELDGYPGDGVFSDDEIKAVLGGETVDAPRFIESVWKDVGTKYVKQAAEPRVADEEPFDPEAGDEEDDEEFPEEEDEDEDGDYEDDLDDGEEEEEDDEPLPLEEEEGEDQESKDVVVEPASEAIPASNLAAQPVWSHQTAGIIRTADEARAEYEENEKKKKDMEREISTLRKTLEMDFGPDESYHELKGNCFEYDTHEYTYKLCPFDKAVQVPKQGGSETNLGRWGHWSGPESAKYSAMKYTNGLKCWNGPDRSTEIKISCGEENKLFSASEPSRCEYRFEFSTPAACEPVQVPEKPHDEL